MIYFCWLLFSSPLKICTSGLGPWWSSGEKVEDCMWLWSSMVLNEDLFCLFIIILAGYQHSVVHFKVYFNSFTFVRHFSWIPYLPPCRPPIIELAWCYHLGAKLSEKNYLKWWKTCFLATWLEGSYKGKNCCILFEKLVLVALAIGELQYFKKLKLAFVHACL